ncbi:MAG: uridylate kinase [Firmicutes bacterium]|uniref:Uridylate kinase n=1 Tax=Candidatus Stercoripulliclostridium pullicola TaxID=2840953 RepID=A0A940DHJ3_9FIRM|nr:uridylate kinase [Candidatus Stercoripulliclostridium pullicola]
MTAFDIELVGKIGSMALIDKANNDIDYNVIARISRELKPGYMWVTSGATEIGRLDYIHRVGNELKGDYADIKTDYAAQGQSILLETYRRFMDSRYSLRQFLVEHQHFNDPMKREHLKAALLRCPLQGAIPIINYNDPVCSEENRKMEIQALRSCHSKVVECIDNDETASQIACLVKPKYLLILSGLDGIYTDIHNADTLVRHITGATAEEVIENIEYYQHYCDGASRKGANGARAKLEYVKDPVRQGTTVMIANSKYGIRDVLEDRVPYTKISISD